MVWHASLLNLAQTDLKDGSARNFIVIGNFSPAFETFSASKNNRRRGNNIVNEICAGLIQITRRSNF